MHKAVNLKHRTTQKGKKKRKLGQEQKLFFNLVTASLRLVGWLGFLGVIQVYGSLVLVENLEIGEAGLNRFNVSSVGPATIQLPANKMDPPLAVGSSE